MRQKGFVNIFILLGIFIIGAVIISYPTVKKKVYNSINPSPTYSPERKAYDKELAGERTKIEELSSQDIPITKLSSKPGWITYSSSKFGYEIDVPAGSFVKNGDNYELFQYTRIQNYTTQDYENADYFNLIKGDYYLEIQVYDSDKERDESCLNTDNLKDVVKVTINNVIGYKGYIKEAGGESAPIIYSMCIKSDSKIYNLAASEYIPTVSKSIVDSFRFVSN